MVLNPHAQLAHALWALSDHFGDLAQDLTIEIDGNLSYVYFMHPKFSGVGAFFNQLKTFLTQPTSPFKEFSSDTALHFQNTLLAYGPSIPKHLVHITSQTYCVWHTDNTFAHVLIVDVGQRNDDHPPLGVEIEHLARTHLGKNLLALSYHEMLELAPYPLIFSMQQQYSPPRFSHVMIKDFGHGLALVALDIDDACTETCLGYTRIKAVL